MIQRKLPCFLGEDEYYSVDLDERQRLSAKQAKSLTNNCTRRWRLAEVNYFLILFSCLFLLIPAEPWVYPGMLGSGKALENCILILTDWTKRKLLSVLFWRDILTDYRLEFTSWVFLLFDMITCLWWKNCVEIINSNSRSVDTYKYSN